MHDTTKAPRQRGFVVLPDGFKNCLNPTTSPAKTQLFGTFDRETSNAVIVLAEEMRQ